MKGCLETAIGRRDLLRLSVAAALTVSTAQPVAAKPVDLENKRKARYQRNSAEVRNFYRVNSYPTR
jgi:hypothetical protein